MGLAIKIEDAMVEANILESTLFSIVDSAYGGSADFKEYEWAFHGVVHRACELTKNLEALKDEAYALQKEAGNK